MSEDTDKLKKLAWRMLWIMLTIFSLIYALVIALNVVALVFLDEFHVTEWFVSLLLWVAFTFSAQLVKPYAQQQ